MTLSRELQIFDASGNLVEDFPLVVVGTMHFPNCVMSIEHFRTVVGTDENIAPGFRSELGDAVNASVLGRKRQGHAAGEIALRLIEMDNHGPQKPSVNKAVFLAKSAVQNLCVDGKPYTPKSLSGLRNAFNEYRPACHLWAASIAAMDLFLRAGEDNEALFEFLAIAGIFERHLNEVFFKLGSTWMPWSIPEVIGDREMAVRVPPLTTEMIEALKSYEVTRR